MWVCACWERVELTGEDEEIVELDGTIPKFQAHLQGYARVGAKWNLLCALTTI